MLSLRPVLNLLGFLYVGLATAMLVPALVDAGVGNADWQAFVFSALLTGLVGLLMSIAVGGMAGITLDTRQAFLLMALAWISIPAFGALPFLWLGIGYADAVFEAMSGFTTTGSTVLSGLDDLPPGLLVWRSLIQWMGGFGIIIMAIVLLPFLRIGGMQIFESDKSGTAQKIVGRTVELMRLVGLAYVFLTILCSIGYLAAGLEMFDAICHAMTTVSTGGFSTHDASLGYFEGPLVGWVAVVFMLTGSLPFILVVQALRGRPLALWTDPQVKALLAFVALFCCLCTLYLGLEMKMPFATALGTSVFHVTSIVSGTGYVMQDYTQWGASIIGIVFLLTFVGGCTGSTTGGIKMFRFLVFFGAVHAHMQRMLRPHRVLSEQYGQTRVTTELSFSVFAFLVVYMGSVGILTLALAFFGLDIITALSAVASCLGNVGPGLGDIIGPTGNYAAMPEGAKWVLSFAMLLGRLEFFALLVLLDVQFWSR